MKKALLVGITVLAAGAGVLCCNEHTTSEAARVSATRSVFSALWMGTKCGLAGAGVGFVGGGASALPQISKAVSRIHCYADTSYWWFRSQNGLKSEPKSHFRLPAGSAPVGSVPVSELLEKGVDTLKTASHQGYETACLGRRWSARAGFLGGVIAAYELPHLKRRLGLEKDSAAYRVGTTCLQGAGLGLGAGVYVGEAGYAWSPYDSLRNCLKSGVKGSIGGLSLGMFYGMLYEAYTQYRHR